MPSQNKVVALLITSIFALSGCASARARILPPPHHSAEKTREQHLADAGYCWVKAHYPEGLEPPRINWKGASIGAILVLGAGTIAGAAIGSPGIGLLLAAPLVPLGAAAGVSGKYPANLNFRADYESCLVEKGYAVGW